MEPKEIVFPITLVVFSSIFSLIVNYAAPSSPQSRGVMRIALTALVLSVITAVVTGQTNGSSVPSMSVAQPTDVRLETPIPSEVRLGSLGAFPIQPPTASLTE
jgi:hypothetical protein